MSCLLPRGELLPALALSSDLIDLASSGRAPQRAPTMAGRSPVYAPNGVAATSQPLATTAALAVLQTGRQRDRRGGHRRRGARRSSSR